MNLPIVFCLMGPTASGKTKLAIELVSRLPCDIVSVDSTMVYKGMDIGTAKPTSEELSLVPHRLIDVIDPRESYSAGMFCKQAHIEITQILQNGRIPLLVGGTMLYFRAIQTGLSPLPVADPLIRKQLSKEAEVEGWAALHARLQKMDPVAAARIEPNDTQRIQRALEVYLLTGKPLTEACQPITAPLPYQMINLGLLFSDRTEIWHRIELRLKQMLQQGMVDEVSLLKSRGDLDRDMTSMRTVGYKQIWAYLEGELNTADRDEQILIATRQLSKRQMTWLRSWPKITFFDATDSKLLFSVCQFIQSALISQHCDPSKQGY